MSLLLSIRAWQIESWEERFKALEPNRRIQRADRGVEDYKASEYGVAWHPEPGLFARCPNLKAIFSLGAGVDHILKDPDLPDVPIVRIIDPNLTMRMTEWVVLQVLLHHRQQRRLDAAQRESKWLVFDQWSADAVRVGILGLGHLGQDAASVLSRIGFQVAGWSRTKKDLPGLESFAGAGELDAFLNRTDILVCLLPLTDDTRGILNRDLFAKLARNGPLGGPVVINAGRGGHQVEEDIIAALDDETLLAASLDVFSKEPLPPESPLWRHPKIVATPHLAAESSPEYMTRNIVSQIRAFESGGSLVNLVDRSAGY
ncbi:MAG: glyoxylate/hydroxypyruvate reductase A [Pseudomonadota bacterium]